jgi:hypothetical protein
MTVDANQFAADNGKPPLGFASPFLYSHPDALVDVTAGGNNLFGGASYQAKDGFDLATGLGSVSAIVLAQDLVADGPSTSAPFDRTTLASLLPGSTKSVAFGRAVTFSGVLRDAARSRPVAHRRVDLEVRMGGGLYVKPRITASVDKPRAHGRYLVRVGRAFTFRAGTRPNMARARLKVQYRFSRRARWRSLGATTVGSRGKTAMRLRDGSRGTAYLRWSYAGGRRKAWLSTTSAAVTVLAR